MVNLKQAELCEHHSSSEKIAQSSMDTFLGVQTVLLSVPEILWASYF